MDYIEKFIIDNWNKIPKQFKGRTTGLELSVLEENKNKPQLLTEYKEASDGYKMITFYRKAIERIFNKEIQKILIHELAYYFGFDEEEAYEIMSKK